MKFGLITGFIYLLLGCSSAGQQSSYQKLEPKFNLYQFFDGRVKAWGIVQNYSGEMVQRFTVQIDGTISDEKTLVLDEHFRYEVGEGVKRRVWAIEKTGPDQFKGRAFDISGQASGTVFGNALRWKYEMDLPVDGTSYRVVFDDWMWAFDDNTVVNRSYIKKFGIVVAEVTLFMQKQS